MHLLLLPLHYLLLGTRCWYVSSLSTQLQRDALVRNGELQVLLQLLLNCCCCCWHWAAALLLSLHQQQVGTSHVLQVSPESHHP